MRPVHLGLCGVLILAACSSAAPPPEVRSPSLATPATSPASQTFSMTAELHVSDQSFPLRALYRANGDETLTFQLDFHTEMDLDSVAEAIRQHLPDATSFARANNGTSVVFEVPPGMTAITVDPRGARSLARPNVGIVSVEPWTIPRPGTTLSLYRPVDLAAGSDRAIATRRFAFFADRGLVRFDRADRVAVMYIAGSSQYAFVDIGTGRRTALPWELNKIASNGAYVSWLPDGRFLTLGTHDTIIAGPRGENMRWFDTLPPGQFGTISPDGKRVALWSYTANSAAIQDLDTGALTRFGEGYLRCSAYANASMQWSPDGKTVAVGACSEDMEGDGQTIFVDVATHRITRTLPRYTVSAWLPKGTMLARTWPTDKEDYGRHPDPTITVLDGGGRILRTFESPIPYGISPDGRWLLDGGLDPQHPAVRLIEIDTGKTHDLGFGDARPNWTPTGLIAILS